MTTATATLDALIKRVGEIATPFSIELPDGEKRLLGEGKPEFEVRLRNERALRAIRSTRGISRRVISTATSTSKATC
jgi:hypothetical protein